MRWVRSAARLGFLAALCGGAVGARAAVDTTPPARPRAPRKTAAGSPWELAERGRQTLEAIPEEGRTRAEYARAMDGYRAIYHANPADVHAPAAVNAVAELLAEQGRSLHDAKSLQAAVGQYEFLRTQYPGCSLGAQALLAEGWIAQNDLGDRGLAREKYRLLLKQHPKSEQAEEASAGLASLSEGSGNRDQGAGKAAVPAAGKRVAGPTHRAEAAMNGAPNDLPVSNGGVHPRAAIADPTLRENAAKDGPSGPVAAPVSGGGAPQHSSLPAMAATAGVVATNVAEAMQAEAEGGDRKGERRTGKKALVTGVRHWSTATYTRVAIDLGDTVTYEAARVPDPDRIYFDLHGTRLAPELVGKSFAVTDDGFLKKIRAAQYSDDITRVVLDVNDVTEYSAFLLPNPYRLIIDIHGRQGNAAQSPGSQIQGTQGSGSRAQGPSSQGPASLGDSSAEFDVAAVSEVPGRVEATTKPTSKPISAVVAENGPSDPDAIDPGGVRATSAHPEMSAINGSPESAEGSRKTRKSKAAVAEATPARAALPTADGETSLVRALGLKIGRIVIDAGHGGHDSGTLGVDGIEEKDVVLDVALRLGKLLNDRLGAQIVYTRSDDTFVPLETRTAIANKAQADLFLSIHANSSPDPSARGVETYYLNFTSDPTALEVAARENAVSDQSIHQLSDLVKKIALKDKIAESREFAADVEQGLYGGLERGNAGLKDRGVKKAPFVVLIGANMPSILAEISFVTNARDAGQLREPDYRQRVAESLYKGVAKYEAGLSGTRPPMERAAVERATAQ
jgi:N-acetylmuramoyl-L-alanine amidase